MTGEPITAGLTLDAIKIDRRDQYAFQMLAALLSNPSTNPLSQKSLDEYVKQAIVATDQMIEELGK